MEHADILADELTDEIADAEIIRATVRGRREQALSPTVREAFLREGLLCLEFQSGVRIAIPTNLIEGLSDKSDQEIGSIEVTPSGLGLYFPDVDCDLLISGLLTGVFGSKTWMTHLAEAGRLGGSKTSERKVLSSRENGKLGGRPSMRRVR